MQARAVSFCALASIPFIGYDSQYQHSKHRASMIFSRAQDLPMATTNPCVPPVRSRRLPSAIYFETDLAACTAVKQCRRIHHASFESLDSKRPDGEAVFVLADQALLAEHLRNLRAPNIRVIMLADERLSRSKTRRFGLCLSSQQYSRPAAGADVRQCCRPHASGADAA